MKEIVLKPCPFCGGISIPRHGSNGFYYVKCDKCGSMTGDFDDIDGAAAIWNRRCRKNKRGRKSRRTTNA